MNEIENVVNYVVDNQVKYIGNAQDKFVESNDVRSNSFTQSINEPAVKDIATLNNCHSESEVRSNLFTQSINEPAAKDIATLNNCHSESEVRSNSFTQSINEPAVKEIATFNNSVKKSVGICEPIAVREQISTHVPGIEYLLHNHMRNTIPMGIPHSSIQNYQQLGDPLQINNKFTLITNSMQRRETTNEPIISNLSNNPNNVLVNTVPGTISTVNKELPLPRKPVGIREPIAVRDEVSTGHNVPGIEFLLHNDMRNPAMRNPEYARNYELFRNQLISNGKYNLNMESLQRKEYKNEQPAVTSMSINPSDAFFVNRTAEIGTTVSREVSVPRKPVGIREPIQMREPMSNANTVPGIEYLLQSELPTENLIKKARLPKEERPFLCTTCGNKFRQQSHLQQHIRIHTNDRPYQCSFCEKAFKQKSQLNQHERIHTGEKPYKCVLCEKAFAQAGQLYSHKKTHGLNMDQIKAQRDGRERVPRKRGRRAKVEEPAPAEVGTPPPSVIYIMEPHARPQRLSTHFQFPRSGNEFHTHILTNGIRYPEVKLPKIETVVAQIPRAKITTPVATTINTNPQLYTWKNETTKEPST